ncbi:MAG: Heparin-sulfate lyase [Chlamydiae bacterium]|nr:Heparin-sulfate lyase [Chlamydiota bacterium]
MSVLIEKIKRALTLPPHILLKKLLLKGKTSYHHYRRDLADLNKSTYSHYIPKLHRLVSLPKTAPYGKHLLDHHFNLLGSGWVEVRPGMQAEGVEGHLYPSQAALPLSERINASNLDYAERVAGFIDPEYRPIDWQIDFKSGYRWSEKVRSHNIKYGEKEGVDIKVPWELARMQHLPQLAWAYGTHKREKYLREFKNQLLDFIANNPPRFGVNWSCTMDVGIRIANWLITYDLLIAYGAEFDPDFERIFTSSIYDHGKHIIDHLEWTPAFRSNHYLANLVGLLSVAAYLPSTPEVEEWQSFSINEFIKEVPLQFHEDGSSFEGSTSYHCLSAQIVAYATALALSKRGRTTFPQWYYQRLEKMGEFVKDITKPNGEIVQIGDHDSGYLFRLFPPYDNHLNRNFLLDELRMESLYKHTLPTFKIKRRALPKDELETRYEKLKELNQTRCSFPAITSDVECLAYPDFGLYIYRSPHLFLSVRVGSIGHLGRGGHAHNDQLSVELVIDGEEIVVDPGTYLYTPLPARRNDYRSVKAHFAPQIPGREPSDINSGVFIMNGDPEGRCLHFDQRGFLGLHRGYGFPIYRLIEFGSEIVITDFSAGEPLLPMPELLNQVQSHPFSPGYGIIR